MQAATLAGKRGARWGPAMTLALTTLFVIAVGCDLWRIWQSDPTLGHAPLIPFIVLFFLWQNRRRLQTWERASRAGFALLVGSALLYIGANWTDIEFMKPLSLIGILMGGCWYLGGRKNLFVAVGALGFLLFTIPWPTTLLGRLQFPLQMLSCAYAAMFSGLLGLPVHRQGVSLSIVPDPNRPPTYTILVAQQCSGLTSLLVLLALGYLIAYYTPLKPFWRGLLFLSTIPLALFCNAMRLTLILLAGASHGPAVAQWVHDHEQPILVFLCSAGLMALRFGLLHWTRPQSAPSETEPERAPGGPAAGSISLQPRDLPAQPKPWKQRVAVLNAVLGVTLLVSLWGHRVEGPETGRADFLASLPVPYRDWPATDIAMTAGEQAMLQPDAHLMRRYVAPNGGYVELAVIAGHRKKTVHTPDYCLAGGGWDTISQRDIVLSVAGQRLPAVRALLMRDRSEMVATYLFTDGRFSTRSLPQFQWMQISKRLRAKVSTGALVRIMTTAESGPEAAEKVTDDFAEAALPPVLEALQRAQRE